MPLHRFWAANGMIEKLEASEHLKQLRLLAAVNSGEMLNEVAQELSRTVGEVVTVIERLDAEELRRIQSKLAKGSK